MNRRTRVAAVSALTLFALSGLALAGPLNPPAGPVASSMKPLTDVEPRTAINATNTPGDADSVFKITQRGSYYLTGNLNGAVGKHGIEIASNDVTIDLNGFDIAGGGSTLDAIHADPAINITIRNGTISGWGRAGIDASGASSCVVDHITANFNANGILVGMSSRVTECVASGNTVTGIVSSGRGLITQCVCSGNNADGIDVEFESTVTGCSCTANGDDGIQAASNCSIKGNTCIENGPVASGAGIYLTGMGTWVEDNVVNGNRYGVLASPASSANQIFRNRAAGNINLNYSIGGSNNTAATSSNFATATPWSNFSF